AEDNLRHAFPDRLKGRTLLLIERNSPIYIDQLSPEERIRDNLAVEESIALLEGAGYGALDYAKDFAAVDFGDRTHLSVEGGRKLAGLVARKVQVMAEKLGYFAILAGTMTAPTKYRRRVPTWLEAAFSHGLSLLMGLFVALVLHYVLYRIDLPSKPFIYVAF